MCGGCAASVVSYGTSTSPLSPSWKFIPFRGYALQGNTFVFSLSDSPNGMTDTITDFNGAEGDVLRFENVFSVDVAQSGANTQLTAYYAGLLTQTVMLDGVDSSSITQHNDAANLIIKITG